MPPQSRDAAGDSLLFVIVGICCEQAPAPPFLILDVLPQIPNDPTVFHKGSSKYTQFFGSNCGKGKMRVLGSKVKLASRYTTGFNSIRVILPITQYLMNLLYSLHFGCGGSEIQRMWERPILENSRI